MKEREAIQVLKSEPGDVTTLLKRLVKGDRLKAFDNLPTESDENLVVVGAAWPGEITGSVQARCEQCNCFIALAPSTQTMLENRKGPVRVLCLKCSVDLLESRGKR